MEYQCPRCGNSDVRYVGFKNGQPYCRKCIGFHGNSARENTSKSYGGKLNLHYRLSKEQQKASQDILASYANRRNIVVRAVCGAGKTELTFAVIEHALSQGHQVGFAIPRRDVVIEIYKRLKSVFPKNAVVAVYGGHTGRLEGEIVVLTTHQLYRYTDYFDLLIMDETDAFPFVDDDVLHSMFKRSCRGVCIMMSATISDEQMAEYNRKHNLIVDIDKRYHGFPLPVPKTVIMIGILKYFYLIRKLRSLLSDNKPVFIFTPTIGKCEDLFAFISKWVRNGNYVHSKRQEREEIIDSFRQGICRYLVTTAVLERGVTLKNLQVIIFESDHAIYTKSALVQIAGRVGRKKDAPDGEVIFLSDKKTEAMVGATSEISAKNSHL